MKKLLLWGALLLVPVVLRAQPCAVGTASKEIHINAVRARIYPGAAMFSTPLGGGFWPDSTNLPTIRAAGIWIAAVNPAGNLKMAVVKQPDSTVNGSTEFFPGPLRADDGRTNASTCADWDRVFSTGRAEVEAFLQVYQTWDVQKLMDSFPGVMGWPARGNPYFEAIYGFSLPNAPWSLAEFFDADSDATYNPLAGDYPVVRPKPETFILPDEILWTAFNDEGGGSFHEISLAGTFQLEVHLTVWAFSVPEGASVLNRTVFTQHRLYNLDVEFSDSLVIGLWTDFSIGCPWDDYVGASPQLNSVFAYNATATDQQACPGSSSYQGVPPVQTVTVLNRAMDNAIYFANAASVIFPPAMKDPQNVGMYYNFLNGHWADNMPITFGGTGYQSGAQPTSHVMPGNPADPSAWSMCHPGDMGPSPFPGSDYSMLMATAPERWEPYHITELVTAWAFHPNPPLPCDLGHTFSEIETIKTFFDNGFVGTHDLRANIVFNVFPNPASDAITVEYPGYTPPFLRLYSVTGQLALEIAKPALDQHRIDLQNLPSGTYYLVSGIGRPVLVVRL